MVVQSSYLHNGISYTGKMASYQCRKSHCGDRKVVRLSYLHIGISYIHIYGIFFLLNHLLPFFATLITEYHGQVELICKAIYKDTIICVKPALFLKYLWQFQCKIL